jgi:hypothetical protein
VEISYSEYVYIFNMMELIEEASAKSTLNSNAGFSASRELAGLMMLLPDNDAGKLIGLCQKDVAGFGQYCLTLSPYM